MWITQYRRATIRYFLRMIHQVKFNSLIGLFVMLSLLAFSPQPSFAGCKNSGGSSGSSKFGSQVQGSSVTICASAVQVSPARSAKLKSTISSAKLVAAPIKPAAKPAVFRKRFSPAVAIKPKLVIAKKTAARIVSKPSKRNATAEVAAFTPAAVDGRVFPSNQLNVGQQASFSSSATQHFRMGTLLNLPTEVRFTPTSIYWDFGGGALLAGSSVDRVFSSAGVYPVQLRVIYAVSYRIKGSSAWISEPDTITLADEFLIDVSDTGGDDQQVDVEPLAAKRYLLVGQDCLQNPGSFGCN